jgi:hypothetical protein
LHCQPGLDRHISALGKADVVLVGFRFDEIAKLLELAGGHLARFETVHADKWITQPAHSACRPGFKTSMISSPCRLPDLKVDRDHVPGSP